MPPVLGPESPSPMRLKSRAGASGSARSPSQRASSESSSPSRNSSTTTGWSPKRRSTSIASQRGARLVLVARDHDALAGRQPVGLEHRGVALDRGHAVLDGLHHAVARGRDAGGRHHLLRERLRALEPGRGAARPEAAHARLAQRVGDARDERRLGADHHEVHAGRGGRPREPRRVAGSAPASTTASARMPALPGRAQQLGRLRRAGERAYQRVLAPTGADDEDLHRAQSDAMKSSIGIAVRVS